MIDTILASAINLPDWLITGLVGAVLGGLGGLLGALLQKLVRVPHLPVILVAAAAAASLQVSNGIVKPAIINASLNANLPMQMDETTTMTKIVYASKRYFYDYQLADGLPEIEGADLKSNLLPELCSHWKPNFTSGQVLSAEYRYLLRGRQISFVVEPEDCP